MIRKKLHLNSINMHAKFSQLIAYHDNMNDITKIHEFHAAIDKQTPQRILLIKTLFHRHSVGTCKHQRMPPIFGYYKIT